MITIPNARVIAVVALVPLALAAAACGGDDATDSSGGRATAPRSSHSDAATRARATSADVVPDTTDAEAGAFPVTVAHKYGETTIAAEPQRVVSIGFAEHDGLLALGVAPIAVRDWYGEQPYGTWPWALDELGDLEPELLAADALNFEQIAALDPDLIIGINSGMTDADYATLSAIAPTVAQPGEYVDWGTPWRQALELAGQATGRSARAAEVIADVEALFAEVRRQHPEFEGASAAVAFQFQDQPGAYASHDARAQMLGELGFVTPPKFDELAGDQFYFSLSAEELPTIDTDVIVWLGTDEATIDGVRDMALRPSLTAFIEGREIVADPVLAGAFSHGSPLSIPFVLDELVPELAAAVDGDPATAVPSAAQIQPGEPSVDVTAASAAGAAWARVFDSTVPYDDKFTHIADAGALRATIEAYTAAGSAMGGISLVPTDVAVDGDTATVTYDVLFGDSVAYSALEGTITQVGGTWMVSRAEFCGFMASARNACPA